MNIWDSANVNHIAAHAVTPEEANQVLANTPLETAEYVRRGEPRLDLLGETNTGRVLVVVITYRGKDLRVVTAFPAHRKLLDFYARERGETNDPRYQHS